MLYIYKYTVYIVKIYVKIYIYAYMLYDVYDLKMLETCDWPFRSLKNKYICFTTWHHLPPCHPCPPVLDVQVKLELLRLQVLHVKCSNSMQQQKKKKTWVVPVIPSTTLGFIVLRTFICSMPKLRNLPNRRSFSKLRQRNKRVALERFYSNHAIYGHPSWRWRLYHETGSMQLESIHQISSNIIHVHNMFHAKHTTLAWIIIVGWCWLLIWSFRLEKL